MSLKAKLAGAKPRTATHPLRIEDDAKACADLDAARAGGEEPAIEQARAALAACYEQIRLVAIPAQDWDDLVTAHPGRDDKSWCNPLTLIPAALVRCVQDSDAAEQDWLEYVATGAMTLGEAAEMLDKLVELHSRTVGLELGKGSTGNRS